MLILLGSLFGIQLGANGTTYVKDYQVKRVMAVIMLTVLFSRFFYLPGYLSELGLIERLAHETVGTLKTLGDTLLAVALILGAITVLTSLTRGIADHRKREMQRELEASLARLAPAAPIARRNACRASSSPAMAPNTAAAHSPLPMRWPGQPVQICWSFRSRWSIRNMRRWHPNCALPHSKRLGRRCRRPGSSSPLPGVASWSWKQTIPTAVSSRPPRKPVPT